MATNARSPATAGGAVDRPRAAVPTPRRVASEHDTDVGHQDDEVVSRGAANPSVDELRDRKAVEVLMSMHMAVGDRRAIGGST